MNYLVAVASESGINVDRHFGQVAEFQIIEVNENTAWRVVEKREIERACVGYCDHERIAEVANQLKDCKYVLSSKIGIGAARILQNIGIVPLEIIAPIAYAVEKIMVYDQRKLNSNQEQTKKL